MSKFALILFFLFFKILAFAHNIPIEKELNKAELSQLEGGDLILRTKNIKDSAWPEITLYLLVESTPIEAMGIFSALDYQKEYVPNIIKSKPIKHISATEVITEYEMHMPFPLSNAHYTHGSVIHQYNEDYELTWYKVESTSADMVSGSAHFSPYKKATLFRYISYIKPRSLFGALVKRSMLEDVQKTILSIRTHIEKLKKENSPVLSKYSDYIKRAINGEFIYRGSIETK